MKFDWALYYAEKWNLKDEQKLTIFQMAEAKRTKGDLVTASIYYFYIGKKEIALNTLFEVGLNEIAENVEKFMENEGSI